jgi:hypothetical protein
MRQRQKKVGGREEGSHIAAFGAVTAIVTRRVDTELRGERLKYVVEATKSYRWQILSIGVGGLVLYGTGDADQLFDAGV